MLGPRSDRDLQAREGFARLFGDAEHLLYIVVGITFSVAGFALFADVVYSFARDVTVRDRSLARSLLDAADGLLLVFIFAELLHTVRVVVAEDRLRTEPFLVIGIVAAIRRFIVASAEASEQAGSKAGKDLLMELGILVLAVLVLGVTIWLLRRSDHRPGENQPDGS